MHVNFIKSTWQERKVQFLKKQTTLGKKENATGNEKPSDPRDVLLW
jgi:hypothetical protein